MTRQHDRFIEPSDADQGRPMHRRSAKRSILPATSVCTSRGPLSMLGMALGYLGLVALLSMAPFFHLAIAPYQSQPIACTDFGGSR